MVQDTLQRLGDEQEYLVAYAKITEDDDGISLHGVFLGGIGTSLAEADLIARDCVNTIRGGTIIPKVLKITRPQQVMDILYDVIDSFEAITAQMVEADETIKKAQAKRR